MEVIQVLISRKMDQQKCGMFGCTAWRIQLMILLHLTVLLDSDRTRRGKDLIIWVTVETLCCVTETQLRLYIDDTFNKKKNVVYIHQWTITSQP